MSHHTVYRIHLESLAEVKRAAEQLGFSSVEKGSVLHIEGTNLVASQSGTGIALNGNLYASLQAPATGQHFSGARQLIEQIHREAAALRQQDVLLDAFPGGVQVLENNLHMVGADGGSSIEYEVTL